RSAYKTLSSVKAVCKSVTITVMTGHVRRNTHRAWFNTANGRVEGNLTQLDEVVLGGIQMNNVQGSISPGMERDTVLLGMSFLNQLAIEIRGGEMVLRLPEP
ncbi:retropepsin-like aspartic protease family protein, partial [Vreelandella aquamarina]|uniref:retropepsin-like aspartic protease family protein n=1 Tax=Vreelandella aquamarina TaxID=77097 RepID=UPI003CFDBFEE